jgi:hypothetical protein
MVERGFSMAVAVIGIQEATASMQKDLDSQGVAPMPRPKKRSKPGPSTRKDRGSVGSGISSGGIGQSGLAVWRDGVALALIPALIGLWPLSTGHFVMPTRGANLVLDGAPARALGIAAIALGAGVHFYFFWEAYDRLSPFSRPAQVVAGLVFFGALGYIAYATFR